jgi:hypothetical protein
MTRVDEPRGAAGRPANAIDLDLRTLASIRLVDPSARDRRAVERQLGPLPVASSDRRDPDVTIHFVDRIDLPGEHLRIGEDLVVAGDRLIAIRGRRGAAVRAVMPIANLGAGPADIVAEHGVPAIPALLPIIAVSVLARGVVPVHGSAFEIDGRGVLVSGWAKGGKSEALLSFLERGARYIGDEWLFVDPAGPWLFGPPEPIRLWDWQLAMVPRVATRIRWSARLRLRAAAGLGSLLGSVSRAPVVGATPGGEAARRIGAIVDRQRSIQVPVAKAFGADAIVRDPVRLDRIVLIGAAGADLVRRNVDVEEAVGRIAATTAHELLELERLRLAAEHARPGLGGTGLVGLEERLRMALAPAIHGMPVVEVLHRQPPDILGLFDVIAALL